MRAPQRLGGRFRHADMADIAGFDHLGDGADRVLDRHRGIDPRRLIEVDVIGAEPAQRIGQKILHRRRPAVVTEIFQVGRAHRAAFDGYEGALALAAFKRVADQHFVVAHAVEIAGIDHGDAGFQRGMHGGDGVLIVGRPVAARHAHAAETESGDDGTVTAEFYLLHGLCLSRGGQFRVPGAALGPRS